MTWLTTWLKCLFLGPLEPREVGKVLSSDDVVVITVLSFGAKNGHQPASPP